MCRGIHRGRKQSQKTKYEFQIQEHFFLKSEVKKKNLKTFE